MKIQIKIQTKYIILLLFISLINSNYTFSHPHVFIRNRITFIFDQNGLAGMKAEWAFDDMFSSMLILDHDINKNGKFSKDEIEKIKNEAFSNIKNFHYFIYILINGEMFDIKWVTDFYTRIEEGLVIYSFFIPCHVTAGSRHKQIKISVFDRDYYSLISLAEKDPVRFENIDSVDYKYEVVKDARNNYYGGQIIPETIILEFRKKR